MVATLVTLTTASSKVTQTTTHSEPETQEQACRAARSMKALFSHAEFEDLEPVPYAFSMFRRHFRVLVLDQVLEPMLTIDGAWGGLEELSLKRRLYGELSQDDHKRERELTELLHQVGLSYVSAREAWDLGALQGVLQVINPQRLASRFPTLVPWDGENRLFTLIRCRRHEMR
ncbi:hypothetical protein [Mitsuaria sp. TWR114]|uniref:hypothetical protein n=1 Tax=Mitsuaria sp. TWR114 TaxID=2601731 RepID=UPI0011BF008F|nr:hypothetical protein [Mitsuaria sp. TWR114]